MKFFQGIKFKVISTIAVILTFCFVGLAGYIVNDQRAKLMGALKNRGQDVANLIAKTAVVPLRDFDDLAIQENILRVELKKEIAYAQLFNSDNEPTVEEGTTIDGKMVEKKKKPEVMPDNVLVIKAKVIDTEDEGKVLGTVEMGFFTDAVIREINKQIKIFVFGLVGLLAIVILIMYVYLSFSIISPVVLLAKAAENLDDESVPIDTKRSDELGSLGKKFVEMRDAVRKRVDDLKTMNAKIEKQVRERTAELNAERNNIANLLNNMRQAVFTVSEEGHIMGPVSQFSEEIFGGGVIGRHIHETIYNGVDKASELFSSINSAMLCVYGSDDLQWDIMKDYLPKRLNYLEENEEDKILKVAYNPLWNEEENLERIMFVVEDITELEKLEKKMAAQKEAAGRNMQMLQELAAGKKEDLGDFFTSAVQMVEMSQKIAKEIRESLEKNEEIKGLDVLFRHLHTIKGNSRVFNLGLISPVVHNVESTVTGFINKEIAIDSESINNFIQDLYLIQGQINEYTKVAKAVFNFDFGEDSRFKVELFNLIKEFELKVSLLIPSHAKLHKGRQKEAEKHYKEWTLENKNLKLVVNDLIKISHSIKGLSRGMDERKLSQATHTFESGLSSLAQGDLDDEKWKELILGPLEQIKSLSRDIYFHSSIFRGFEDNSESWVPLFVDSFKLTSAVQGTTNENKGELISLIDKVRTSGSAKSLDYIPLVMDRMDKVLEEENFDKEEVDLCLKELWNFLSFLSSMNVNNNTNDEGRKIIRRALTTSAGLNGIPTEVGLTTFHLFLKDCLVQGFEYNVVLETLSLYLNAEGIETIGFFVPKSDLSDLINKFFSLLNKKFSDQNVKNYISKVKKEDSDFAYTCDNAFGTRDLFWFRSVKEVALLRLLRTYIESDDDSLEDSKPQILEVLSTNFEDFKALLKDEEKVDSGAIDLIRTKYERLLDLPVKYSFNKFKTVVKEVAEGLNKKIKFKLSGDQGSLNKDKLYLLQDSMMHLVRNSLDHGIELPDIRVAKGKPELGTVEIECSTKENHKLRIIIRDDGGGIDADKVCAKGVEQGLITKEQAGKMSKSEKLNLIFASTLSTKEEVSEISGRGVGMDVVKKNLEEIGSKIEIQTELGKGTEFIIDIAV